MSCKNCYYFNENETSGAKCYCDRLGIYVYDTDDTCSYFESKRDPGGCFLTTACCSAKGLADDCYELNTLRKYRDTYLINCENGNEIIKEYYKIAPKIVETIDSLENRDEIYFEMYKVITLCVELIEKNENERVFELYKQMVFDLKDKYYKV